MVCGVSINTVTVVVVAKVAAVKVLRNFAESRVANAESHFPGTVYCVNLIHLCFYFSGHYSCISLGSKQAVPEYNMPNLKQPRQNQMIIISEIMTLWKD